MPTITISDAAYAELKSLAEPFVDTADSLTAQLIHAEVLRRGAQPVEHFPGRTASDDAIRQNPVSHETLKHTRLLSATVDGREMEHPKWNGLMDTLHIIAMKRLGSFNALQRASSARLRQGRFENEGFKYLPEADLSIQGVDANLAWDNALKLARALGVSIVAQFEWREKEDALHPGKRGILAWNPTRSTEMRTPRLAHPHQAADFRKLVVEVPAHAGI